MQFPKLDIIPPYIPTAIVLGLVLYLTLFPKPLGDEPIELFEGADKIVHFLMFGGLCGTFIYDRWRMGSWLTGQQAWLSAVAVSAFGALVEWLLYAMAIGRAGNDVADALANALGAFAAMAVCRWGLHWVNIVGHHRT